LKKVFSALIKNSHFEKDQKVVEAEHEQRKAQINTFFSELKN